MPNSSNLPVTAILFLFSFFVISSYFVCGHLVYYRNNGNYSKNHVCMYVSLKTIQISSEKGDTFVRLYLKITKLQFNKFYGYEYFLNSN